MATPAPPRLSIVVVSFNPPAMLARCLASLERQAAEHGAEVLVVRAGGDGLAESRHETPVRWVSGPPGETIPRLRQLGIRAAAGDIVGLLEDDCIVDGGWCAAALAAHAGPWIAVGGAIEPGRYARARDWAVYFYEYGRFMLPFDAHDSALLPGNNVTYKRDAVAPWADAPQGFYEVFVHDAWAREGRPMRMTPTLVVKNENSWPRAHLLVAPFHHGRGFAAQRVSGRSPAVRGLLGLLAMFLPLLQTTRIARQTLARGHRIGQLVRAVPWIFVFAASWAAGECAGYLLGPGHSIRQWR
jgi:glycosyltransferase involved in cell wall biosynthesis